MTPEELDAVTRKIEETIEAQRVKFQWFLFLLPLIFGLTYGLAYAFLASTFR